MRNCNTTKWLVYDAGNDTWVHGAHDTLAEAKEAAVTYCENSLSDDDIDEVIDSIHLEFYMIDTETTKCRFMYKPELSGINLIEVRV